VLAIHTGHVVPYARLIESVWGVYDVHHSALLKTHLSRVRRKLGVPAGVPGGIRNIAGVGYVLNRPEVAPQGSTPQTSAAPVRQDQGAPARRTA
jgi:DNA-binding response OmpR family regulator